MILKPQDIFIMLKLVVRGGSEWSYPALSYELSMSASEVHAGVKRAVAAKLMDSHRKTPVKSNLLEFIIHGVKYAYPPDRGGITRGIPTGYAASPLKELIMQTDEPPPVWPDQTKSSFSWWICDRFPHNRQSRTRNKSNKRCRYNCRSCFKSGVSSADRKSVV